MRETTLAHQIVQAGSFDATVLADRAHLTQVFTNILDNAIKYSPAGGIIRIEGETTDGPIRVRISDEGLGIAESQLPFIFDRFHRAPRPETETIRSTGLGLYLARGWLTQMGGVVAVESELNVGTTLTVTLRPQLSMNAADSRIT